MKIRKIVWLMVVVAAFGVMLAGAIGCQSSGGYSGTGSDGHAGHSH